MRSLTFRPIGRGRRAAGAGAVAAVATLATVAAATQAIPRPSRNAAADLGSETPSGTVGPTPSLLLTADRIFDGETVHDGAAILVRDGTIVTIGPREIWAGKRVRRMDLGDATILPGLIEMHSHILAHGVSPRTVLLHGITTARDVGGPVAPASGGRGALRLLTAGPMLTAPGGYPVAAGFPGAVEVADPEAARRQVQANVAGGATHIKVALDPGGEVGAPWTAHTGRHASAGGHGDGGGPAALPWPLMPSPVVSAIVDEAHRLGVKVVAHAGEARSVERALEGGIDELAHIPCDPVPPALLRAVVEKGVTVVSTLDTLYLCTGVVHNAQILAGAGAQIVYGAEVAHPEIPWGIDARELALMVAHTGKTSVEALRAATSEAGRTLGLAPLGSLAPAAPADLIAVRGNPFHALKVLEYPELVMSGGEIVMNAFTGGGSAEDPPARAAGRTAGNRQQH